MKRILFCNAYSGLGGGETSLLALMRSLDRTHYEPVLACPREGQLSEAARALGIDTHVMPYRGASIWFVPSVWAHFPASRRFQALLRRLAPSAVYSDYHSLPYLMFACQSFGIPVIFYCFGWWFRPKPWQRQFFRAGPDRILACSDAVKKGFLGDPPFMSPDRVQTLYPGVDTGVFQLRPGQRESARQEFGLPQQTPVVTLIARYQWVKGQDTFLAAARLVAAQRADVRFAVAGENVFAVSADEAYKRRILSMVEADVLLRDRVTFLGWVEHPERLIAASDCVVCSSRFESFGMVPVEAMASGVPVVSTNVGGTAETIVDGQTGYLVPPNRPDLLAARVIALLDNHEMRIRMGRVGRERVAERFSLERFAAGFVEVLDALTDSGG